MTRRRNVPVISAIVLVAMAAAGAWWLADQHAHVSTSDARVRAQMVSISADVAGRIEELPIRPGDRVARGDVLARLDERRAKLALAEASLDLKAIEIAIERLRLEATIDRARGDSLIGAALSGLDTAQADIDAARASLAAAQADHARKQTLHASGLIADAAMDRAGEALELARVGEVRSLTQLASRRAGLAEAQADATAAGLAEQDAERLVMEAAALRQRIAVLKLDLEHHTIASPINGVVDEVFADAGEHIQAGARIALAHATTGLWIEANIKEPDIGRVAVGAHVEIRLDASARACSGEVERIGAATTSEFALVANANPAGVFTKVTQRVPVRIRIGGDCEQVRAGAMANLRIKAG
jgi:membrane fusion protein (multidrug efflux system)